MKTRISILLLLYTSISFGQETDKPFLTQEENSEWIKEFKELTERDVKFKSIMKKIRKDSLYTFQNGQCRITIKDIRDTDISIPGCECKILFVIQDERKMYNLDLNDTPSYSSLLNQLNFKMMDEINVVEGPEAGAIFGSMGRCGVVIMKSKKKLNKIIKRATKNIVPLADSANLEHEYK